MINRNRLALLQNAPEFAKQGDGDSKYANHDKEVTYCEKLAAGENSHKCCGRDNQNQAAEFYHDHASLPPTTCVKASLFPYLGEVMEIGSRGGIARAGIASTDPNPLHDRA